VLSRVIAIVEARLQEMEQRLAHISAQQTGTAKAIGEAIITAAAAYVAERLKDAGADVIEKVRTSISPEQAGKQSDIRRSRNMILICSAMTAAFAAGFLAASLS
jgi:ribulose kinase